MTLKTLDDALQQAIAHHEHGNLQEAERMYRSILQVQPKHPDANHNLGVLAMQVRQPEAGLAHFKIALEANLNQGQYWLSYVDALIQTGQAEAARHVLNQGRQLGLQGQAVDALDVRLELPDNDLETLIKEERYSEAVTFALELTARFPQYGLGWKMLGVAFKLMGRLTEALTPMETAAELLPEDADVHCNLGATLHAMGRLDDAVSSILHSLEINPDLAEAHFNLGLTFMSQGQLAKAESSYRRALEIKQDFTEAHNNLGNALFDLGRLAEAEASYRRALAIRPDFADAHCNLGNTLHDLDRLCEAEASCRHSLKINPGFADGYYNLGNTLCAMDDLMQTAVAYEKAFEIAPSGIGLSAAVYLAILHYLDGNHAASQRMIKASRSIAATTGLKNENVCHYWFLLERLLAWHRQSAQDIHQNQGMSTIYVIGESHALSAHGLIVRYHEQEMRCVAEWIQGCKQWHLGNARTNRFKHKYEAVVARLPRNATLLLSIGEIDCRHNEGILKAWAKCPDKALDEVIRSTVGAYINYVAAIGSRYGHRIIVSGVPAINMPLDTMTKTVAERLIILIRNFNKELKGLAQAAGMGFLDVYALTDRGDGIASGERHIDGRHLLPSTIVEAFDRYCASNPTK